ncbi:MAG: pilus assembly protein TadG-related protein [Gemmataceae bacterium]|nr:pilus assembly protein TadG-related protein [Gemmataceae bacterium]MDW8264062.1 pilus assembly protein TadG-related protein [Gemmataceae bacterium]
MTRPSSPTRLPGSCRRGMVLVPAALISFALFALAAMVLDLGIVRVTQRQMQTGADMAALEGFRGTRTDAQLMVRWAYDDDFANDPTPFADPLQLGAGPRFEFSPGVGSANAWQTITPPKTLPVERRVYKPLLALNLDNQPHGDLVWGRFAQTNLAQAIGPSDTSLVVVSAEGFAGLGPSPFDVLVENEIVRVTGGFGTPMWTVTRGHRGSTATAHPQGAVVRLLEPPTESATYARNDFAPQSATLANDVGPSDTTLNVSSATGFPTSNGFAVRIDDEWLAVIGGAGTTSWTVQRGIGGSAPAAHAAGAEVIATDAAFLARLRCTKDLQGNPRNPLDEQAGISSADNALPLLLGRASLVAGADPNAGYSVRHHGISVRATAIASGQRVKAAGAPHPSYPLGVTPFAWSNDAAAGAFRWDNLAVGVPVEARILANGEIRPPASSPAPNLRVGQVIRVTRLTAAASSIATTLQVASATPFPSAPPFRVRLGNELLRVLAFADPVTWVVERGIEGTIAVGHPLDAQVFWADFANLGQPIRPAPAAGLGEGFPAIVGYVPVAQTLAGGEVIIGFGSAQLSFLGTGSAGDLRIQITKFPGCVAPGNATAAFRPDPALASAWLPSLLDAHRGFSQSLLAPTLAR